MQNPELSTSPDLVELVSGPDSWAVVHHVTDPEGTGIKWLVFENGVVGSLGDTLSRKYMERKEYIFEITENILAVVDSQGNPKFTCFADGVTHQEVAEWYKDTGELPWAGTFGVPDVLEGFSKGAIMAVCDNGFKLV